MTKITVTNKQMLNHKQQRLPADSVTPGGVHQDTEPVSGGKISVSSNQVMGVDTETTSERQVPSIDLLKLARSVMDSRDVFEDELLTIKHEYPAQASRLSDQEKRELAECMLHITPFCIANAVVVMHGVEILRMIGTPYAKYVLGIVKNVIGHTQRIDYDKIIDPVYNNMMSE